MISSASIAGGADPCGVQDRPERFRILEIGPGSGRLAHAMLTAAATLLVTTALSFLTISFAIWIFNATDFLLYGTWIFQR